MDDADVCACGHALDEHDDGRECQAEAVEFSTGAAWGPCPCVHFDANDE